jgi:hypothetical protein
MSEINKGVLKEAINMVAGQVNDYRNEIARAYQNKEVDEALKVSLGLSFKEKAGRIEIKTSISFTTDKVKDEASKLVDDKQLAFLDLPDGVDSMTISSGEQSVIIEREDE